jgi:chloride channel protein, CIC family
MATASDAVPPAEPEREPAERDALGLGGAILLRLVVPALIGAATGACVAAATLLVEGVALGELVALPGSVAALFSPAALLVTLAVATYVTRVKRPSTAELYIHVFHEPGARLPLRQLPGRILAAASTVGFGGSQGLESPSALTGAAFGDVLGHASPRVPADERRALVIAGASAGIAAVFSSPAVGTFYGMEVPFRRDVDAPRFVPCAVAASCAYAMRAWIAGARYLVTLRARPELDLRLVVGFLAVGLCCGLGARLFAWIDEALQASARRTPALPRAIGAGLVLGALAWGGHELAGEWITFGPGYIAADWLLAAPHPLWVLGLATVIRTAGTLTCVYGGGGGGVFTSLACTGAFLGQIVAVSLGATETQVLPLLGAACFLGAGYRLPIGCAMLVAEASGDLGVTVAGLCAIALAQVLMGEASVSDAKTDRRAA